MKFELPELKRTKFEDFIWWWFIKMITNQSKRMGYNLIHSVPGWKDMNAKNIDVEFKINGVEINLLLALRDFKSTFEDMAEKAGKRKVDNRVREIFKKSSDVVSRIVNSLEITEESIYKEVANKLGFNIEEEDDYYE